MLLNPFLFDPSFVAAQKRRNEEAKKRRLKAAVPWTPDIKWQPELNIQATTYEVRNLFPECPVRGAPPDPNAHAEPGVISPCGEWLYGLQQLPAGTPLNTWRGSRIGTVMFDGPVLIPTIHQAHRTGGGWRNYNGPWMSQTPAEMISMRGGTKLAKGHTVIAGLGLGYQLIEVSKRKKVTKLTLVETSAGLVSWILPRVRPHLGCEIDVIVGDAYQVLPKLTADVALVDIFDTYGHNDEDQRRLRESCFSIGHIWCWGTARIPG